jgi:SAM-dependent methyltransferase
VTTDQREFQRSFYDEHYPKRLAATLDQLDHPLFRSWNDRLARRVYDFGAPRVPNGTTRARVFEPGCGDGFLAAALARVAAERGIDLRYAGADLSEGALELARRSVPDAELLLGDAAEVTSQLPGGSQDVVVMKNLLHHLDDPAAVLAAARRVVAPRGRVVVVEPLLGCPHIWVFNVPAFRREKHYFKGQRRNLAAFGSAGLTVVAGERFSILPWELAFYIRPSVFRRLFSTNDAATIRRVSDVDDWLTDKLRWVAAYQIWVAEPAAKE